MYTTFNVIGEHRGSPRLWLEGQRLTQLGLSPGTVLDLRIGNGCELILTPAVLGNHTVSYRRAAGGLRPIIEVNNRTELAPILGTEEVRITGSYGRLAVKPSIRATMIQMQKTFRGPYKVLDVFAGGGTLSKAFCKHPDYQVVAAVEIEADFADEYALSNPNTHLFHADFRRVHPDEYPEFHGILAGIPCTEHSTEGRAKKKLAGKAELGEAGDLFIPVLELMAKRLPLFGVFENVPSFGTSLAGQMLVKNLQAIGYHVTTFVMEPNTEWDEPTTRRRWVCFANLRGEFKPQVPMVQFTRKIREFLDPVDPIQDKLDAERIAVSIAGLERHNARHSALGHGFQLTVLTGEETSCPTITKSYHKINSSGAYIQTPWGPRQLRKSEVERLMGHTIQTNHYATAIQISGQGVLSRPFEVIGRQHAEFLRSN